MMSGNQARPGALPRAALLSPFGAGKTRTRSRVTSALSPWRGVILGPGQVLQQDAAKLIQGGRVLLRAVSAREDGFRCGPVQVGAPERDDQVIGGVAGEPEGDRVVRYPRRHRETADGQQQRAIDPKVADRVDR